MLRVPSVRATVVIREGRLQTLESHIGAAHDGLSEVGEAVNHVPVMVVGDLVAGLDTGVGLNDGELDEMLVTIYNKRASLNERAYQAVQLVGDGGGEDGLLGPDDGGRQVVVLVRVIHPLEAHAIYDIRVSDPGPLIILKTEILTRHQLVPVVQRLVGEEL